MSQYLRLRSISSLPRCCVSSPTGLIGSHLEVPVPTSLHKYQSSLLTLAGITLLLPTLLHSSISLLSANASSKQLLRITAEAGITAVVLSAEDGMDHVQITNANYQQTSYQYKYPPYQLNGPSQPYRQQLHLQPPR